MQNYNYSPYISDENLQEIALKQVRTMRDVIRKELGAHCTISNMFKSCLKHADCFEPMLEKVAKTKAPQYLKIKKIRYLAMEVLEKLEIEIEEVNRECY